MVLGKSFKLWHKLNQNGAYSVLLDHRNREDGILFESQVIATLSSAEIEAVKKQYTKLVEAYGCLGLLQTGEGGTQYLVMVTGCVSVGKIGESEIFRINQTTFVPLKGPNTQEDERVTELRKLLNSGTYYFSWAATGEPMDITLCAQRLQHCQLSDNRFFWNKLLHLQFQRFGVDCSSWLLKITCGSFEIRTVYAGHRQFKAAILSRMSCERAGTRFQVRGVNDDGHVANFVETEQAIFGDQDDCSAFIQTRGSVPLFWEQPGVQVGSHKVKLSRSSDLSQAALERHMNTMKQRYGSVAIVNLLGLNLVGAKEGEASLSQLYESLQRNSCPDVPHIMFDYHQECKGGNMQNLSKLQQSLNQMFKNHGLYVGKNKDTLRQQTGVIRTNCLDCLDRTNCVQTFIGLEVLEAQLEALEPGQKPQTITRFQEVFRQMWVNNGNEISKIYAGTGAIQGGSKIMDGARSAARTIQNNLLDSSKQDAFDLLLTGAMGTDFVYDVARSLLPSHFSVLPGNVLRGICSRYAEFTDVLPVRVAVGTYNVNGGHHFRSVVYKDATLADWLLDGPKIANGDSLVSVNGSRDDWRGADIFAVGFEEIVDLNASNIMAASSENAKAWAAELQKVLSRDQPYALLTYVQLVGVCLYVFIRTSLAGEIRDVAVDSVKTGLGGATGNKGGVAIRFVLRNTSLCFVCSHFAAGQSQWSERNADFAEITRKIEFSPYGRKIEQHDFVFWCGDFNYRIDLDRDTVKELIADQEWTELLKYDQLKTQQTNGNVFNGYIEGDISFAPTYKYDLFSDDYDTSEKCRAPAWTDRVLFRKRRDGGQNPGRVIYYGRAELKQSDHRPVLAIIDVDINVTRPEKLRNVLQDTVGEMGPPDATILVQPLDANEDPTEWADVGTNLTQLIGRISQVAGEVLLLRFAEDGLILTLKDGGAALNAVNLTPLQIGGTQLRLTLRTHDWPAAIARDFRLVSDSTAPLCCEAPVGIKPAEDDVKVLSSLAETLKLNNGIYKNIPAAPQPLSKTSPKLPRPLPPTTLPLQQSRVEWTTSGAPPPRQPPPPAPSTANPLPTEPPPIPARNNVPLRPSAAAVIPAVPPPIPQRSNLPPVPPRTAKGEQ